jgi:hypothetical protein
MKLFRLRTQVGRDSTKAEPQNCCVYYYKPVLCTESGVRSERLLRSVFLLISFYILKQRTEDTFMSKTKKPNSSMLGNNVSSNERNSYRLTISSSRRMLWMLSKSCYLCTWLAS